MMPSDVKIQLRGKEQELAYIMCYRKNITLKYLIILIY